MKFSIFDLIKIPVKFFWGKINNWLKEKRKLKNKLKETEEKYKLLTENYQKIKKDNDLLILSNKGWEKKYANLSDESERFRNLLQNEKKSSEELKEQLAIKNQNFNNLKEENAKLKFKLENKGRYKDYLQEKKLFIENYYKECILRLKGYVCSFTKEKEIIFSLLNLFLEEYLHAFCLKERIFQDDFILFQEFFSLRLSSTVNSTTSDKNLVIRDYLIRASLYITIRKHYGVIGKIGIDKSTLLGFIIDEYIQKHAMQLLRDYFIFDSYSSFVEESVSRISHLKGLVIPFPQNIPVRNSAI